MNGIIVWSPGVSLDGIEKQVILKAFEHYRKNKTATAGALGISIRTLDTKLDRYASEADAEKVRLEDSRAKREQQLAKHRGEVGNDFYAVPESNRGSTASRQVTAGVRMESPKNAPTKQAVPVPERGEVQEVLPKHASGSGSRGRR